MMIPGQETLFSINRALESEHGQIADTDKMIDTANTRLINLQKEQASDFKELARLKVDQLASGKIISRIDDTEKKVVELLQSRQRTKARLDEAIIRSQQQRKPFEDDRSRQAERVEQASRVVDTAEAETQKTLGADPAYQVQRQSTEEAERMAKHAEDKATRSARELNEKGQPYSNDPLFMYLWNRHYGTADYQSNPLTRWLDNKVARLVAFTDARANYFRLQEIPLRLNEHAQALKKASNKEFEILRELDTAARKRDGIPNLEAELEKQQNELEAIDARIEENISTFQDLIQQKSAFAAGEDEQYLTAIKFLASEMTRDDLQDIRREAISTPFPEDDVIVSRLQEREEDKVDLEQKQRELKQGMRQHQKRLAELESLRSEFKRRHYDQAGSGFSDGALVAMTLADFLNGMLTREALMRVLEQQQRYRPYQSNPTFGSGGFGRGTVWGGGFRVPRGGGFRLPGGFGRGGSSGGGGGGFRTGGGF